MEADNRSLIEHFEHIEDPRIDRKKLHKLIDIIVIAICGVISGADSFDEIEIFGNAHIDWLKRFLELPNGIPSHDTFERVFRRLNPQEFKDAFLSWTKQLCGVFEGVIAIDGQTHRGARNAGQKKSPLHVVSAFASDLRLVLAQMKVDEKSNEITAIPKLLKLLDIKGCIVTIDAMGCQQKIAGQIIDQDADYALGLKGNQGSTLESVKEHFSIVSKEKCVTFSDVDKGHGRIETREHFVSDASAVFDLKDWPGLKSVIKVVSTREFQDKTTTEERFYISSLESTAVETISHSIRAHWGIENSLHYVLDVTFGQDKSRIRKDHSGENFGLVRHFAMNMLRNAPVARRGNKSLKLKRKRAAMDIEYLETILKCGGLEAQ